MCNVLWTNTLADWSRVEGVVESESSDVRVSSDALDARHFADLSYLTDSSNAKLISFNVLMFSNVNF
jgi:hypothetical protein